MNGDRYERENYIGMLAQKYPKCFFEIPQDRIPLKKGIENDLADDLELTPASTELIVMRDAVNWYRSHIAYQYALKAGRQRVGLNGEAREKVTLQEERDARKEIARISEELNERRQQMTPIKAVVKTRPTLTLEGLMQDDKAKLFEKAEKALQKSKVLLVEDRDLGATLAAAGLKIASTAIDELIDRLNKESSAHQSARGAA